MISSLEDITTPKGKTELSFNPPVCVSGLVGEPGHETEKSSSPRRRIFRGPYHQVRLHALLGGVLESHTLLLSYPTLRHRYFSLKMERFSVFNNVLINSLQGRSTRQKRLFFSFPQYLVYIPVLRLCILIRLLQDLLKDWQLYIAKPLDIHTIPSSSMLTQLSQQSRVACRAVH